MEKLIYVKFQYESQYPRQQFFKEIGKEIYYGRDHFLLWHTIVKQNEQMILEMVVKKDITFVICDMNNQKLFISSNNKNELKLPLLRYSCLAEWALIKNNYRTIHVNGFSVQLQGRKKPVLSKWLLLFKEDFESNNQIQVTEEAWISNYESLTKEPEILHCFEYCGKILQIYRIQKQHDICKKIWLEYYAGNELVGIELFS